MANHSKFAPGLTRMNFEYASSLVSMWASMTRMEGPQLPILKLGIVLEGTNIWVSTCRLPILDSSVGVELKKKRQNLEFVGIFIGTMVANRPITKKHWQP